MARKPNPFLIDDDNPALTDEELASARPAAEVLPPETLAELTKRAPGQRGPGKRPARVPVTLRLDADVVAAFKATGPNWQARMRAALANAVPAPAPKKKKA